MSYTKEELEPFRFPIGRFSIPENIQAEDRALWIEEIKALPQKIRNAVQSMSDDQLDTPYRPEGWTVRQLIHHIADSHLNSYIRFKWTLTEDTPTIKTYDQKAWASLPDGKNGPVELSLDLLDAVHARWSWFLERIDDESWKRSFIHPDNKWKSSLEINLALYRWHGNHHLAHITHLVKRMNW